MTLKASYQLHTVTVELLRSGPPHNQLLSPLTDYLALCGNHSAVSVRVPYEHGQFANRFEPLGYGEAGASALKRKQVLAEAGRELRDMLNTIPGLSPGLAEAVAGECDMTHLQLVLTPHELALLAFECMYVPDGAPGGHGQFLLLQVNAPVCLTRAVRGVSGEHVVWPEEPRVLFAWAGDDVPYMGHLVAIRRALSPWMLPSRGSEVSDDTESVGQSEKRHNREQIKQLLTIIPNATIDDIYTECSKTPYTHVHILAHGITAKDALNSGDAGLGMVDPDDPSRIEIVEGRSLANALRFRDPGNPDRICLPAMVTLASCDSGNVGSVITHGASIAHDLHNAGIPFVIASQFPLSKPGSVVMAEELYQRMFNAEDPRVALHYVRRRLFSRFNEFHDWASIVAYAALPSDMEQQLARKQYGVAKKRINRLLEEADSLIDRTPGVPDSYRTTTVSKLKETDAERLLMSKLGELGALEDELLLRGPDTVESLGIIASSEKRRAEVLYWASKMAIIADSREADFENRSIDALVRSRNYYEEAVSRELSRHWVVVQYVSMTRILMAVGRIDEDFPWEHWTAAKVAAEFCLKETSAIEQSWAHASLAELYLLKMIGPFPPGVPNDLADAEEKLIEHIRKMVELSDHQSFEIYSTRRQLARYVEWWSHLQVPVGQQGLAHIEGMPMIIPPSVQDVIRIMPVRSRC